VQSINDSLAARVHTIFDEISRRCFDTLVNSSLEADGGRALAGLLRPHHDLYERFLVATVSLPRRWYDWNVGFVLPHLSLDFAVDVIAHNREALAKSEGIAWALGEIGVDDSRVVDFLYFVCERCLDYDAWWCAAEALEKLGATDATDLRKKTLTAPEWQNLEHCLANLSQRPAVIGVLRLASFANTEAAIIPACRAALHASDVKAAQNAVWLLERLRVDDDQTIDALLDLFESAEDVSHTLRPRVVEALGQIAAPQARELLETALGSANYYRTRAYAARGLGRIGDTRSLAPLENALRLEEDPRVLSHISDAIYCIRVPAKRMSITHVQGMRWPENGMVVDDSNKWYGHPEVYDQFSAAEDPLSLSHEIAVSHIPVGVSRVVDVGTGTGRFALFAAERRPDIRSLVAVDASFEAVNYLSRKKLGYAARLAKRVFPMQAVINALPFEDASVDAVTASWSFPSKMFDPAVCLADLCEVRRVLRPGGLLVTIGWDETHRDQLSEIWYRFVPEPDFRREPIDQWRRRRLQRITSPRNCNLTFVKTGLRVPLLFPSPRDAAFVVGHLFGVSAGEWVSQQQRCEFSIYVGITCDNTESLDRAISMLRS
jgi:SAM-dependent methyltransferase